MADINNLPKKENRKVYLDLNTFTDDFTLKVLPYVNNMINAIDVDEIKEKYPDNEADQLNEFVEEYLKLVQTNPGPISSKLIEKQMDFCHTISNMLAKRVCDGPTETELFFKDTIENFDSFYKPIKISLDIFNATRFVVQDIDDIYTVSLLTLMNMINLLEIKDKDIRFNTIKIVGRKNEYDVYYIGIKELEMDYKLYYQKNIVESTILIMNTDIEMLMDAYTAATIMNDVYSPIINDILSGMYSKEEVDEILSDTANFISEQILGITEDIGDALYDKKYKISPLCEETLNICLSRYEPLKLVKDEFNYFEMDFNIEDIFNDCKKRIYEYLELIGYER